MNIFFIHPVYPKVRKLLTTDVQRRRTRHPYYYFDDDESFVRWSINITVGNYFVEEHFRRVEIFVIYEKIRHFSPTKLSQ